MLAGVPHPDARLRARARELFSCALETPGGLKVQTIHALCTRLLQQFPFEANVPARFAVLDDRDQFEIMERSILAVLLDAAAKPQSDDRQGACRRRSQAPPTERFATSCRMPAWAIRRFLQWIGGNAGRALAQLHATLGLRGDEQLADVEREIVDGPHLPIRRWPAVAAVLDGGSANDQKQAETLRAAYALAGTAQVEEYLCLFLTQAKDFRKSFVTQRIAEQPPGCRSRVQR